MKTCISNYSNSESNTESDDEEGQLGADDDDETKNRKSRVDPKEIPEVTNNFLMRAAYKDKDKEKDDSKDSDSDSKHSRRKNTQSKRNDSKGYVLLKIAHK